MSDLVRIQIVGFPHAKTNNLSILVKKVMDQSFKNAFLSQSIINQVFIW